VQNKIEVLLYKGVEKWPKLVLPEEKGKGVANEGGFESVNYKSYE
jgi:hypothetical protein